MKSLLIAAAFSILRIQAQLENMEEVIKQCIQESKIDPEEVEDKKMCEINTQVNHFAEYIDCFSKGMNLMDDHHKFKKPILLKFETEVEGTDLKAAQKAIDRCVVRNIDFGENTALYFTRCSCHVIEVVAAMHETQEKCIEESNVDEELVEKNNKCIIKNDRKLKSYMVCYATELGILSPEGKISKSGLRDYLEFDGKIKSYHRILQIVDKCAAKKETPEETIFKTRKCVCSEING